MEKYAAIINAMEPEAWYKATQFEDIVKVKETRIKELLADLCKQGKVETTGSTKGRMYKKVTK